MTLILTEARRAIALSTTFRLFGAVPRRASSAVNPFPYPTHAHPTPQQIFHLPENPSQADVKSRYYDLVKLYHPDSPTCRSLPAETRLKQFQSIRSAYDTLRGKTPLELADPVNDRDRKLDFAKWKAAQYQKADFDIGVDDRWKDRLIFGAVILALAALVLQVAGTRRQVLANAVYGTTRTVARKEEHRPRDPSHNEDDILTARTS